MSLTSDAELSNTREKLAELESRYAELQNESIGDQHVREMTMRSLKRYIHQFKEEISRYEARHAVGR
jgi:uncharacterized protein YydD (DUF2326 family)